MSISLRPAWIESMNEKIRRAHPSAMLGEKLDQILDVNIASQWLIMRLAKERIPFKVYNLGAGVKRITTDTDTCPCCKKSLKEDR